MHCHTRYGSIDAKVRISEYVKMLSAKGYDGMLVTDHDSYRGYNRWKSENPDIKFRVIRGVEYDTRDAGHFIVILPDGVHLEALTMRGMKRNRALVKEFDFIEGFNACETETANDFSQILAKDFHKPIFGGSDSHDYEYVGMGYTLFSDDIYCCDDLISAVHKASKSKDNSISCGGIVRGETLKSKHAHAFYSVYAFIAYNVSLGLLYSPFRKHRVKKALEHK